MIILQIYIFVFKYLNMLIMREIKMWPGRMEYGGGAAGMECGRKSCEIPGGLLEYDKADSIRRNPRP